MTVAKAYTAREVIDKLITLTAEKDLNIINLYDDSPEFRYINTGGQEISHSKLLEMYQGLFSSVEYVDILENKLTFKPISLNCTLCLWQGKESVKMKDAKELESSWTGTIVLNRFDDSWKITHFHLTHF